MPGEEEALWLLEERKKAHIPDESKRVIPPKMKEVKKKSAKERKRKRDSSSHGKSATKRASLDIIRNAIPLQARSAEG